MSPIHWPNLISFRSPIAALATLLYPLPHRCRRFLPLPHPLPLPPSPAWRARQPFSWHDAHHDIAMAGHGTAQRWLGHDTMMAATTQRQQCAPLSLCPSASSFLSSDPIGGRRWRGDWALTETMPDEDGGYNRMMIVVEDSG